MSENTDKQKKLRDWFAERPALTIKTIEEECGVPLDTLQKFVKGRGLPKKHWGAVLAVLEKYGLKSGYFK